MTEFYSKRLNDLVKANPTFASVEEINRKLLDPLDELHGVETYRFTQSRHETMLNVRCKYKNCAFHLGYTFDVSEEGEPCSLTLSTCQRGHSIQAHTDRELRAAPRTSTEEAG